MLTRYEIVRQRARTEGLFVMSTEGRALQLLCACGVPTNQMMQLLQPFITNLPANEQQLNALFASMKRTGHITENTPGNIGATLHGSSLCTCALAVSIAQTQMAKAIGYAYSQVQAHSQALPNRKRKRNRHAMRTKGNGKGQPLFHVEALSETLAYFSGNGKGNRRHTSGKGTGRRMNPTGRDGQVMKCRVCNPPEHYEARCPQSQNTSTSPQLFTQTVEGPLTNILSHTNHGVTSYPIFSTSLVNAIEEPPEEHVLSFMARERTSNDPIWQQESDPWQGTSGAVPKPPPQEHARMAPEAKAAPEQERSP